MKRVLLPIIVLTFTAASLLAADAAPGPSPKLKEVNYFVGNWHCAGTGFAFMGMPEHKTSGTVEASWTLDGYWLSFYYRESKASSNPHPVAVRIYWGWDEQTKKFSAGAVDNMGGYYIQSSPGWEGDKMTFDGDVHSGGATMKVRDVFTKMSATKVEHMAEVEMDGKWSKLDEETCTKK